MRKRLAVLILLVVMLIPATALAYEPQVIYSDSSGDVNHYVIVCDSNWSAVAYALGRRPDSFTTEQCKILSDPSLCPHYVEAASQFTSGHSEQSLHNITWVPVSLIPQLVVYSQNDVYLGTLSDDLKSAALSDVLHVLNGDITGGGGTGNINGTYTLTNYTGVQYTGTGTYWPYFNVNGTSYYMYTGTRNGKTYNMPEGNTITLSTSVTSVENQDISELTDYVIIVSPNSGQARLYVYMMKAGSYTVQETQVVDQSEQTWLTITPNEGEYVYGTTGTGLVLSLEGQTVPFSFERTLGSRDIKRTSNSVEVQAPCLYYRNIGGDIFHPTGNGPWEGPSGGGGGGGIFYPEVPEPPESEPVEPDNPTPPTYTTPTVPNPVVVTEPVNTSPTDYTPWLRAIYQELENLREEMSSYIDDIIMLFTKHFDYMDTIIQDMATHCIHLQQRMKDEFENLEDYLYELFQWLSEQMQFNFEGYDDTSLIQWLRKIYSRLGTGDSKPDPVIDPTDFWTWLNNLLGGILEGITSALPTALQSLLSDVSQLSTKFPFSAPWDLFALLALFSASPVTPVFDLTLPMLGQNVAFHVDLTGYNGVMAAVRTVEKVIFAAGLVYLTMRMFRTGSLTLGGGND